MKTSWMFRTLILAGAVGVLCFAAPVAQADQNTPASTEQTGQTQQDIQAELAAVKAELKAVRADLKKVLAGLAALRTTQAKPTRAKRKVDTTVYNIDVGDSPFRGPKDAPVTVVEFASFSCGWCIREVPTLTKVLQAHPNDVRWVFKHRLRGARDKAPHAAAALAQKQQGNEGFWKMHDLIIAEAKKLEVADLRKHAESMGMNLGEFDEVMADPARMDALVAKDMADSSKFGVGGTPTIFVNGLKLAGQRTLENYGNRINAIVKGKDKAEGAK